MNSLSKLMPDLKLNSCASVIPARKKVHTAEEAFYKDLIHLVMRRAFDLPECSFVKPEFSELLRHINNKSLTSETYEWSEQHELFYQKILRCDQSIDWILFAYVHSLKKSINITWLSLPDSTVYAFTNFRLIQYENDHRTWWDSFFEWLDNIVNN